MVLAYGTKYFPRFEPNNQSQYQTFMGMMLFPNI